MKTPEWVKESMFRLRLRRRDTLLCTCGAGGCELSSPPDCDQYKIATCVQCAEKWAVFLGRKK